MNARMLFVIGTTAGLAMACTVCVARAEPAPQTNGTVAQSSAPKSSTADFLQPLSRDIERQLPELGTRADKTNREEPRDPGFRTLWTLPTPGTGTDASPGQAQPPGR